MSKRVGIVAVSGYVPEDRVDLRDRLDTYGVDRRFIEEKTGAITLARKRDDQETSDLAEAAILGLMERYPDLRQEIGLLIVVTQNPDGHGLPHVSALLHGRLGLDNEVAAFDLSLGCSGWVYGLAVAQSFMEANGIERGLIVTADPYSKVLDPKDRGTSLLFGDAATATLLSASGAQWVPGRFVFGTDGTRASDLAVGEDGLLHMNGRGIFTFCATRVPSCIAETLARNDLSLDRVDRIILHQGSRYIVETIGQRVGAADRTPFLAHDIGNTVSSTIPIILSQDHCAGDQRIVVCGFGVGLSWAATVLTRSETDD